MGRSGSRGGGGRSGGGRSGGSRSSGRSARSSGSSRSSSGRSFSSNRSAASRSAFGSGSSSFGSSNYRIPTYNRSANGRPISGRKTGSYTSHRPIYPTRTGESMDWGRGVFSGGYVQTTPPPDQSTVYNDPQQTIYTVPEVTGTNTTSSSSTDTKKKKSSGVFTTLVIMIIFILIIMMMYNAVSDSASDITKSTIDRDKLNLKVSTDAGYYTDECGWIQNRTELETGLKEFYHDTGIVPYVYIIDNVEGDYNPSTEKLEDFAAAQYERLFHDEGHLLLVHWDYDGAYEYTIWLGEDTWEFMDNEACDILFDYLDYYYYYADTDEGFFADAFAEAGEHMMTVTRSSTYYILMIVGGAAAVYAVYSIWKSRRDKEAERKRRAEEILNAPLQKFGKYGDVIDDLEKKYEKEI